MRWARGVLADHLDLDRHVLTGGKFCEAMDANAAWLTSEILRFAQDEQRFPRCVGAQRKTALG